MDSVWLDYKTTQNVASKNVLIEHYVPLVKIIAGRLYTSFNGKVDYDDVLGYGILGLLDSIEKFDLSKNVKFETYANLRIRGYVLDEIRNLDWIPRSLRTKSKTLEKALREFEYKFHRTPTNSELAEFMSITLQELESLLSDTSLLHIVSLDESLSINSEESSSSVKDSLRDTAPTPDDLLMSKVNKELLITALDSLSEQERNVVTFYYYEELTYKEIASLLGVSEGRISQIHSKAILRLKSALTPHFKE